jgi:hypothetical protein
MAFLTLSSFNHDRFADDQEKKTALKRPQDILQAHGLTVSKANGKMTINLGALEERKVVALMEDLRSQTAYMLQELTDKDPNAAEPLNGKAEHAAS